MLESLVKIVLPFPLGVMVIELFEPVVIVVPEIERLFVPKSRLPTFWMLLPAELIAPPKVNALIVNVLVEEIIGAEAVNWMELSASCVTFVPELLRMLPVEADPRVSVWALVVPMVPLPVNDKALLPVPAILAVGVPAALLTKANLADVVAEPPTSRSTVFVYGVIVPGLTDCQ